MYIEKVNQSIPFFEFENFWILALKYMNLYTLLEVNYRSQNKINLLSYELIEICDRWSILYYILINKSTNILVFKISKNVP